jgi:Flp pilus assembly protein TadB
MSLRPHEQRILADVEDQLSRDDPALADLLARHPPTTARRDYSRPSALTVTRRSAASMGPSIGLIVAAMVVALVVGGMQIAMLVLAVVLLCAAHVLRWRARRALFERIRGLDIDA